MDDKTLYILEKVQRMYRRYGIKSVTMDDVSRDLGISKKTLYEHFSDKEDLIQKVLDQALSVYQSQMAEIETKNLNALEEMMELYRMIHHMFMDYNPSMEYDIRKYYPTLFLQMKEARRKSIYDTSLRNLNKGKKEGLYRKDLNAKTIARLQVFQVENLFDSDLFSIQEITSLKVFHEFFVYTLHGILSEKGRNCFEKQFPKFKTSLS
jgi:TetR/AcrR family transcriptional regulator, cholesterol catabolism regulator